MKIIVSFDGGKTYSDASKSFLGVCDVYHEIKEANNAVRCLKHDSPKCIFRFAIK